MQVVRAKTVDSMMYVAMEWKDQCNAGDFGIGIDPVHYARQLGRLIERDDAELFLLTDTDHAIVGYMGVVIFTSPLDNTKIASEHHFYILRDHRGGIGSMRLVKAVREWARERGCTHLIMNASTLAGDLHDKVCRFYESMGMKLFETSYIQEIA